MASEGYILQLMLDNIDASAWQLHSDIAQRMPRIVEIAKKEGLQPDAELARYISRVKSALRMLEAGLEAIECERPVMLEAAE